MKREKPRSECTEKHATRKMKMKNDFKMPKMNDTPPAIALSAHSLPLPNTSTLAAPKSDTATTAAGGGGGGDTVLSSSSCLRTEDTLYFKEEDPIRLFRAPLDHSASIGFTGCFAVS